MANQLKRFIVKFSISKNQIYDKISKRLYSPDISPFVGWSQMPGFASSTSLHFITHSLSIGQTTYPMQTNGGWTIPSQTLVLYDESDYKCLVHGGQHPRHYKGWERSLLMDKWIEKSFIIGQWSPDHLLRGKRPHWNDHLSIVE